MQDVFGRDTIETLPEGIKFNTHNINNANYCKKNNELLPSKSIYTVHLGMYSNLEYFS